MKKIGYVSLFLLSLSFFFSSCASVRGYEDYLSSWQGKSARDLVAEWGEPQKTEQLADGGKVYHYFGNNPDNIRIRDTRNPTAVPLYDCQTSFVLTPHNVVLAWHYEGYDCQGK